MSPTHFSVETLDRAYRYLQRFANSDGRFSGGWNWHELDKICAGPRSYLAFSDMRVLGWITTRTIPNSYGHEEHHLIRQD